MISQNGTLFLHDDLVIQGDSPAQHGIYRFVADGDNPRPTLYSLSTSFVGGVTLATAKWAGSHTTSGTFVLPPGTNFHGVDLIIEFASVQSSGSTSLGSSRLLLNHTTLEAPWTVTNASSITLVGQSGLGSGSYLSVTSGSTLILESVPDLTLDGALLDASSTIEAEDSRLSLGLTSTNRPPFNLTTLYLARSSLDISNVMLLTNIDPMIPTNWTLDQASQATLSRLADPPAEGASSLFVNILDLDSYVSYDHMDITYSDTRFDSIKGPTDASDFKSALMRRFSNSNVTFTEGSENVVSHAVFSNCDIVIDTNDGRPLEVWWSFGTGSSLEIDRSVLTWHPITPDPVWFMPSWYLTNTSSIIVKEPSDSNSLLQLSSISNLSIQFPDSYIATGSLTSDLTITGSMTLTQGAISITSIISGDGSLNVVAADSFHLSSPDLFEPALYIESVLSASIGGTFTSLTLNRSTVSSTSSILGDGLNMDSTTFTSVSATSSTTFNSATLLGNVSILSGILKLQTLSLTSNARVDLRISSWSEPTSIEARNPIIFGTSSKRASGNSTATIRIVTVYGLAVNDGYHSARFLRTFSSAEMSIQSGPIAFELYGLTASSNLVKLGSCYSVTYNASGQGYYLNSSPASTGCRLVDPGPPSPGSLSPNNPGAPVSGVVPSIGGGDPAPAPKAISRAGLIVGIVVGVLILAVFILIFALIIFPLLKDKWEESKEDDESEEDDSARYTGDSLDELEETPRST